MQRRIFRIEGRPFVATRDGGGFFETHGTLLLLIGGSVLHGSVMWTHCHRSPNDARVAWNQQTFRRAA